VHVPFDEEAAAQPAHQRVQTPFGACDAPSGEGSA
jgi:hypothetical protein